MVAAAARIQDGKATSASMDPKFIEENHIIEKYLSGALPLKGQLDFERYCLENPDLLDDLKLADRLHRGMRLLESGRRSPRPRRSPGRNCRCSSAPPG